MAAGGRFVITMPAVSYARELWRLGEPELARRAAAMSPSECAEVGERAGHLHLSGAAARLWAGGPNGVAAATMLAVIEHLEGRARPCARSRRLPERSVPAEWQLTDHDYGKLLEPIARAMDARLQQNR